MSEVFFVDARARSSRESLVVKLDRLFEASGIKSAISPGEKILIKTHMGAPLCTRYLRPFFVRRVVERVKEAGGKPFVVETTGLGLREPRGTAQKYLEVAAMHGFTGETLGAPIMIADGENGEWSIQVEVEGDVLKRAFLAGLLEEADALINLTHFKGHHLVGIGGALKNLAIGLASKEGKYLFHFRDKPRIVSELCDGCGVCLQACPVNALTRVEGKIQIQSARCIGCIACLVDCPRHAIATDRRSSSEDLQLRLADMALAVVKKIGKDKIFNLNFLLEVDWMCDCEHFQEGWSDLPIVPDLGILSSMDPVAVDLASVDLVTEAPGIPSSKAGEVGALAAGVNKFDALFPNVNWRLAFQASEKLGVGKMNYLLKTLKI